MQCDNARELFSDYVGGSTDRALTLSLENHLAGCNACRDAVADMRLIWATLDQMPVVETPPFLHENLMYRIAEQEAAAERARSVWDWRTLFTPRRLGWSAAALVVVLGGAGVVHTTIRAGDLGPLNGLAGLVRLPRPAASKAFQSAEARVLPLTNAYLLRVDLRVSAPVRYRVQALGQNVQSGVATPGENRIEITVPDAPDNIQLFLRTASGSEREKPLTQWIDVAR